MHNHHWLFSHQFFVQLAIIGLILYPISLCIAQFTNKGSVEGWAHWFWYIPFIVAFFAVWGAFEQLTAALCDGGMIVFFILMVVIQHMRTPHHRKLPQ